MGVLAMSLFWSFARTLRSMKEEQEDERDEDDVCGTGTDGDREPEEVDDGPAE